jgi:hypothetical protein
MTNLALGTAVSGLLVLGFALVGEALPGRRSRDLPGWNESFLIGLGICGAALFPLSVALPGRGLDAELAVLALGACVVAWRRLRGSAPEPGHTLPASAPVSIGQDPLTLALLAAVLAVALFFAALNAWYGHAWDSIQVWGTKAERLYYEGALTRRWFFEQPYDARILSYPPMISLFEALFSRICGAFDFDRLKSIFPFFYASMLLGTFVAAGALCSRRWALATTLLVALLPELTTGASAGGYVDMPLAAFVAASVASSLRHEPPFGWRSPLPWLLGAMTTVKQEGMILMLVACGALMFSWIAERPRRLAKRFRSAWTGAALILAFLLARVGYVRWIGVHDGTWGPLDEEHLNRAADNVTVIVTTCARLLLDPRIWGLFWPAFLVSGALALVWKEKRTALLAAAVAATIAIDAALFLLTNWDVRVHIEGAYTRLLAQLAPAAAVVIAAASERVWSRRPA